MTGAKIVDGAAVGPSVKVEPGVTADGTAAPSADGAAEGEVTNVLVPKKKARRKRSPSSDEDLPVAPPPMKTIRLERMLDPHGGTMEWNILEDAREKGMVEDWVEEEKEVAEMPRAGEADHAVASVAAPSTGGSFLDLADGDPEEIARRLEEKYGDAKPKKPKKASGEEASKESR